MGIRIKTKNKRFPGVRPFESKQSNIFFGRDEEIRSLATGILSDQITVLFGKSGYGKSSLINAGLLPYLEKHSELEDSIYVPVKVRFGRHSEKGNTSLFKVFRETFDKQLYQAFIDPKPLPSIQLPSNLWGAFKHWNHKQEHVFVLIFDQFEEFFSFPDEQQAAFKYQLEDLLFSDYPYFLDDFDGELEPAAKRFLSKKLDVRALFSIRSDNLSKLNSLSDCLPGILNNRFEIKPLGRKAAEKAIVGPTLTKGDFQSEPFEIEDDAKNILIKKLSSKSGNKKAAIETFLLQVACSEIEQKITDQGLSKVSVDQLPDFGDLLDAYYEKRISKIEPEIKQRTAEKVLEKLLVLGSENGQARRLKKDKDELVSQVTGLDRELLETLTDLFLIRAESGDGGTQNYEISHDALIAPILKSKKKRNHNEMNRKTHVKEVALKRKLRIIEKEYNKLQKKYSQLQKKYRILEKAKTKA